MSNNITINTNQEPYYDDFDDDKNFHQVMYKPALPVQARELTTQQSILRDQIKKFGDHVFKNGSKVTGADLVLNLDFEYVKLSQTLNGVNIDVSGFDNKTIIGKESGTKALVLKSVARDSTTGDPDTLFVKYISGEAVTQSVQAINVVNGGNGFVTEPNVTITPKTGDTTGSGATAIAKISNGKITEINVTNKGSGYTVAPDVNISGGGGVGHDIDATINTKPTFDPGELISATDFSVSANVIPLTPASIQTIDITRGGSNYTVSPNVTISAPDNSSGGTNATATSTIVNGVVTEITITNFGSGYDTVPTVTIDAAPAGGVTATATATLSTPTGKGSSASIEEGVFYVNGNFIKTQKQTIILEKYFNNPSYKIGVEAVETIVSSNDDISLTDNAQGSTNFAAPGADRLKLILNLEKKTLTSTDDTDFYELLRVNKGIKERDINVPVYSVLEETFARRTFDESGSYTVRSFNIQLKDDPTDDTKFIVRLDPGKAFVEGFEFETLISTDIKVDKARSTVDLNNFDRLMQYGNYVIVKDYNGLFDITNHAQVDLHNVAHGSLTLTNPTTYSSSKIGTAKVRNITFDSGTGSALLYKMYLYDIQLTSSTFASVESIVIPVDAATTPVDLSAKANIDATGQSSGDTILFETSDNTLVFKLPQDTIKTIRDKDGNVDTSYTIKRVFPNQTFTNGSVTISSAGSSETFVGADTSNDSVERENYIVTNKATGAIVPFDGPGQEITVNGPANTTVTLDANTATFTGDIIATLNIDNKQEKVKTLVKSKVEEISSPNTTALSSDSLNHSDCYKVQAVYDSGNISNAATLPTLNVSGDADLLIVGEEMVGETSGAKGIVVSSSQTVIEYVVVSGTFQVSEVVSGTTSLNEKTVDSIVAGDTEIKNKYDMNTGQKDNFYDHGSIKLKEGQTGPTGQIKVVFDYFTHSGVGYLSVDSYATLGTNFFSLIPKFESPVTGEVVELRDCIDFRPRRADEGTAIENIELPVPNENWQADYSYYLPRTDTVYLSRERKFGSNTGVPSLKTTPPPRLDGTMNLYTIYIPAFTFKASDVTAQYIENKRYTMRDIGKLEKRIANVEYYTSLSLLEKDAEALVIKDNAGLDRFKNGILVDGFNGHSVGNVLSSDYKCAIDFDEKILRPSFNSNITDVFYSSSSSAGVQKTGDCVTLPYTTTAFVDQSIASKAINVNPFAVLAWVGTVELDPPSDNWVDTTTNPEVIVNLQGENDAWESLVGLSFGTQFNDWQTLGTGRERVLSSNTSTERRGGFPFIRRRTTQTVEQSVTQTRTGIRNEITGVDTVRNSIGDRIVDVSVVPFIRPRDLSISVKGMKPNTRVYAFFDGVDVSSFCKPNTGQGGNAPVLGDPIYTNDNGSIEGLTFSIPSTDSVRFRTGERQFLLVDNTSGDLVTAATYAEVTYAAQGLLQTKENVVVSTRVPRVQSFGQGSATEFRTTTNTFDRINVGGWFDPLAETFLVDESLYPDGIFLSDVDLFFKSKDDDGLPISVQIRDTLNGYPAQTVLPFSDVSLLPDQVNISEDASKATKFTFPSLVYLQPGEYAIVALSNSLKYEAYISEMGENIIGTNRKISEQPYAGVLFKSQNASTWSPDQNQDLTFVLNRAKFTTGSTALAVFKDDTGTEYNADIIQIVPQEVRINNTGIFWDLKMTNNVDVLDTNFFPIIQNTNFQLPGRRKIGTGAGTYEGRARLTSTNEDISPVIDTKRNSVITIENIINNVTTNETNSEGGDATARYITRRVNLKDGFDATDLQVFMTANRQSGSTISVYYKVLSQFDSDTFDNRPWTLMTETSNDNSISASDDLGEYLELEFSPVGANTNYISNTVTYDSFKTFAIKIVMTSADTTKVPLIKDLRAIALA